MWGIDVGFATHRKRGLRFIKEFFRDDRRMCAFEEFIFKSTCAVIKWFLEEALDITDT